MRIKESKVKAPIIRKFTFKQLEQIRVLRAEDPVAWNYERLALSFGVDEEVSLTL